MKVADESGQSLRVSAFGGNAEPFTSAALFFLFLCTFPVAVVISSGRRSINRVGSATLRVEAIVRSVLRRMQSMVLISVTLIVSCCNASILGWWLLAGATVAEVSAARDEGRSADLLRKRPPSDEFECAVRLSLGHAKQPRVVDDGVSVSLHMGEGMMRVQERDSQARSVVFALALGSGGADGMPRAARLANWGGRGVTGSGCAGVGWVNREGADEGGGNGSCWHASPVESTVTFNLVLLRVLVSVSGGRVNCTVSGKRPRRA